MRTLLIGMCFVLCSDLSFKNVYNLTDNGSYTQRYATVPDKVNCIVKVEHGIDSLDSVVAEQKHVFHMQVQELSELRINAVPLGN